MNKIIDSHAHVTCDELYERADEIITNAMDAGLGKILTICCTKIECERAITLAKKYPGFIDVAFGLYPVDMPNLKEQDFIDLEELLHDEHIVAVGEIGLDYHWDEDHHDLQKAGFIRQIELANKLNKPIIVHMRDATKDTLDILKEHLKVGGIMHCYSGSVETAKIVLDLGMYISFAGPITFKNAKGLTQIPEVVPMDRILVETDSPYLTPHPLRGQRNEPRNVIHTFKKVCELKGVDEEEMKFAMWNNYHNLMK